MSAAAVIRNVGTKIGRRLSLAHKPLVRLVRRRRRAGEHEAFARDAAALERHIAALARGDAPIVAGPWLAEVGYEVLYWVPFLRWFCDAYRIPPQRLTVVSRGGMEAIYAGVAGAYVDLFDLMTPSQLAARNAERQATHEAGGQKQSGMSAFEQALLADVGTRLGRAGADVLHPSIMFRLFRHAWHGTLPMDAFWRHTVYQTMTIPTPPPDGVTLPADFIAAKIYTGPALSGSTATRAVVRTVVERMARQSPVILLETSVRLDEHRDFDFEAIPGVISARSWMTPRTNLAVQLALISRARLFLGSCGGLAWAAPFLGVPTVALYDSDQLLAPHLLVARQAGARAGAAEFTPLDLRALAHVGIGGAERPLG